MKEYKIKGLDIELADIDRVEAAVQQKFEWMQQNYPYARTQINKLEDTLHELWNLRYDFPED